MALTNYDFLQVGKPGASPWLGGVDSDTYGGDLIASAKAAVPGLTAVSPNYGFPQNGKVGDPGFRFYPDKQMVTEAHANGIVRRLVSFHVDPIPQYLTPLAEYLPEGRHALLANVAGYSNVPVRAVR